ncbi:hypothetical protein MLD38_035739 [Melastoma candidum]|uniref:Uncharacterized protein n=1 Tax=Melastoma candidum TaxID=119954 RepID=A0ACB9LJC2_9MYRT|nr:hypothetical protein MLD38_035739 [Melastoma candidum]
MPAFAEDATAVVKRAAARSASASLLPSVPLFSLTFQALIASRFWGIATDRTEPEPIFKPRSDDPVPDMEYLHASMLGVMLSARDLCLRNC